MLNSALYNFKSENLIAFLSAQTIVKEVFSGFFAIIVPDFSSQLSCKMVNE